MMGRRDRIPSAPAAHIPVRRGTENSSVLVRAPRETRQRSMLAASSHREESNRQEWSAKKKSAVVSMKSRRSADPIVGIVSQPPALERWRRLSSTKDDPASSGEAAMVDRAAKRRGHAASARAYISKKARVIRNRGGRARPNRLFLATRIGNHGGPRNPGVGRRRPAPGRR